MFCEIGPGKGACFLGGGGYKWTCWRFVNRYFVC